MSESFAPEIVVLYCAQSVDPKAEISGRTIRPEGASARMVAMPCSSKVEAPHILKLLESGADAVLVVACPEAGCRFLVGSRRAEKRVAYVRGLLDQAGMGAERAALARGGNLSAENLTALARERAQAVQPLGRNPLKGGNHK